MQTSTTTTKRQSLIKKYRLLKRVLDNHDALLPRRSLTRVREAMMRVEFTSAPSASLLQRTVDVLVQETGQIVDEFSHN